MLLLAFLLFLPFLLLRLSPEILSVSTKDYGQTHICLIVYQQVSLKTIQ